jgi:predicted phage terminase large subunit-like protein
MMPPIDPNSLPDSARLKLIEEACRRSLHAFHLYSFARGTNGRPMKVAPYVEAMTFQLERFLAGQVRNLIISIPPRFGKSELASISLPAFALGIDPALKLWIVSYGLDLARGHVGRARALLDDPFYRRLFPGTVIKHGKDKSHLFGTTRGGEVRAVSTGGAATGHGTDIVIIDDLHKADEALSPVTREAALNFYRNTLLSRFNNPADARILVIGQRLHEEDIVGYLKEQGGWHHLNLAAICEEDEEIPLSRGRIWHRRKGDLLNPEHLPLAELEAKRLSMGDRLFGAQYQQNPIAADGGQVRLEWFGQYDERPRRTFFHKMVQSWDTAATDRITSDFSVGMTWGYRDGEWYLLDIIRARLKFHELVDRVKAWHRQWKADALIIENASTGMSLWQEVKRACLPGLILCPTPTGSKLDRLAGRTAQLATGDYLLPAKADWLADLRHELVAFPDGRYDDQIDALVQFLEFVTFQDRWVRTEYNEQGRPIRLLRPTHRRARYYDGDAPSAGSLRGRPE